MNIDAALVGDYLAECRAHLAAIEADLHTIEKVGAEINEQAVNSTLRAVHSVRGVIFLGLVTISKLAEQIEDVMALIRSHEMVPTPDRVRVLLGATGKLRELIQNSATSNQADVVEIMADLSRLRPDQQTSSGNRSGRRLRLLLVEDDPASRLLLQTFLSRYGDCRIVVKARKAVEAVRATLERGQRYDLICMDIMMPEMDGSESVRRIRALEEAHGISPASGQKIIVTTAVGDIKEVIRCFQEFCDAYLVKPIDLHELRRRMKSYQLI